MAGLTDGLDARIKKKKRKDFKVSPWFEAEATGQIVIAFAELGEEILGALKNLALAMLTLRSY